MKTFKTPFCAILVAVLTLLTSCGKQQQTTATPDKEALEETVVAQLDSLAHRLCEITGNAEMRKLLDADSIQLTAEQQLVKPDYLLEKEDLDELVELSEKYRARGIVLADANLRELYQMNGDEGYQAAVKKMELELNDALLDEFVKEGADACFKLETYQRFYDQMKDAGRLVYFYDMASAMCVETLYLISCNPALYEGRLTDEAAAAISENIQTIHQSVSLLAPSYPHMHRLFVHNDLLSQIHATTAAELIPQLLSLREKIAYLRTQMLEEENK